MKHSKDSIMGQYPSPYDAGPYPSAPGGSYEAPHGAGGPTYGPGGAPYAGGQAYAPNGAPSNQAVPMAMPAPMPMPMPAPVFVVPPPNPEEVAEKSRRTTRGLGLGATRVEGGHADGGRGGQCDECSPHAPSFQELAGWAGARADWGQPSRWVFSSPPIVVPIGIQVKQR